MQGWYQMGLEEVTGFIRKFLYNSDSGSAGNGNDAGVSLKNGQIFDALLNPENGLYVENYFLDLLYLERKRAERLGHPFLLMLLDFKPLPENERQKAIKTISDALTLSMREVDVKGWYLQGQVIGAIFTGAGASHIDTIRGKFNETLKKYGVPENPFIQKVIISFHVFPDNSKGYSGNLFDKELYPDISSRNLVKKNNFFIKRIIDIFGSIAAILVFSPFFILLPLLIKMTSEGPVFFRQERMGQYGKRFTFLKFRTMANNNSPKIHQEYIKKLIRDSQAYSVAGNQSEATYKIKADPRVTPLGNFLRKTSLDEIPQFFNVLKGEMSLVGPRPPIPYELEDYEIWHLRRVLEVQPGITGLWQVKGRSRTTFNEMVRLDLQYINKWSLWLDVKLILQTPWSVFSGKGAY